jgi:hypothetical protein
MGGRNERRTASFQFRIKVISSKNDTARDNIRGET